MSKSHRTTPTAPLTHPHHNVTQHFYTNADFDITIQATSDI